MGGGVLAEAKTSCRPQHRMRRSGAICGVLAGLVLTACTPTPALDSSPAAVPSPTDRSPASVGQAQESEVPSRWDQPTTVQTPAAELAGEQRIELLRIPATADAGPDSCSAESTHASLGVVDPALGSRYAHLTLTNRGSQDCTLQGYPGVGARGAWDNPFVIEVEQVALTPAFDHVQDASSFRPTAVQLAPGESAVVPFRYTGALGGADSEPLDALVLQLARDTAPVLVHGAPEQAFDLSMFTTVYVGPFQQTDPDDQEEAPE